MLHKYSHEIWRLGPYDCFVWDGNGTFNHLEVSVCVEGRRKLYWKQFEYNTVTLAEVKAHVANHFASVFAGWAKDAERAAHFEKENQLV